MLATYSVFLNTVLTLYSACVKVKLNNDLRIIKFVILTWAGHLPRVDDVE
jgi:hypothetical protein